MNQSGILLRRIRWLTSFFIVALVVSGLTAIPLEWELELLAKIFGASNLTSDQASSDLVKWILKVREGLHETNARFPFVSYGTDWLAFGHIAIAIAFIGAWRDPVQNIWLFEFGIIVCVMIVPWAFFFGELRGIPIIGDSLIVPSAFSALSRSGCAVDTHPNFAV